MREGLLDQMMRCAMQGLTASQTAQFLGFRPSSVSRWGKQYNIPFHQLPSKQRGLVTLEYVREYLRYDQDTGIFNWTTRHHKDAPEAGCINKNGYIDITIWKRRYLAHRLAWFYVHGHWPEMDLDHIDRDRLNNRISNLRLATKWQNAANRSLHGCNTSGKKGISFNKRCGMWQVQLRVAGKRVYNGLFSDIDVAHAAYIAAAKEHCGEFAHCAVAA